MPTWKPCLATMPRSDDDPPRRPGHASRLSRLFEILYRCASCLPLTRRTSLRLIEKLSCGAGRDLPIALRLSRSEPHMCHVSKTRRGGTRASLCWSATAISFTQREVEAMIVESSRRRSLAAHRCPPRVIMPCASAAPLFAVVFQRGRDYHSALPRNITYGCNHPKGML